MPVGGGAPNKNELLPAALFLGSAPARGSAWSSPARRDSPVTVKGRNFSDREHASPKGRLAAVSAAVFGGGLGSSLQPPPLPILSSNPKHQLRPAVPSVYACYARRVYSGTGIRLAPPPRGGQRTKTHCCAQLPSGRRGYPRPRGRKNWRTKNSVGKFSNSAGSA